MINHVLLGEQGSSCHVASKVSDVCLRLRLLYISSTTVMPVGNILKLGFSNQIFVKGNKVPVLIIEYLRLQSIIWPWVFTCWPVITMGSLDSITNRLLATHKGCYQGCGGRADLIGGKAGWVDPTSYILFLNTVIG